MAESFVERERLLDSEGRPLTQSLFLEIGYSDQAIYTFKEVDHVYNGKTYISLKKRFIEMEDPTEYEFAITYFLSWKHWQRICKNKLILEQINEWREELEMKLRSRAVKQAMQAAGSPSGNFQAAKWLVDKGWDPKRAGRPTRDELERESRIREKIDDEYSGDIARLK
jgi:hypothetical protein